MGNLANLLSFEDFDKNWKSKPQKSTKRTDVGIDVLNENLYMKVMNKDNEGWKANLTKFIQHIMKSINDNQVKNIDVDTNTVSFTIRNRKHKINKSEGSITLWRTKATQYRNTFTDEGGRVREEKKKRKTREEIEVVLPINKNEAVAIYNALKERAED